MPYKRKAITAEEALAVREYYTNRCQRKSKRRLMRLLAKNFDEKDFMRVPLILRSYRTLNRTPDHDRRKWN